MSKLRDFKLMFIKDISITEEIYERSPGELFRKTTFQESEIPTKGLIPPFQYVLSYHVDLEPGKLKGVVSDIVRNNAQKAGYAMTFSCDIQSAESLLNSRPMT